MLQSPTMTQNPEQRLIGTKEVAHLTGISVATLRTLRYEGHPLYTHKAIKTGKNLQWKLTDVTDYINNLPYAENTTETD